jgi:mRNA-degrading endonuclease RelE of RelBE toxin-antitoxin system
MMTRAQFSILFDEDVETHLAPIERDERAAMLAAIKEQLTYEPGETTRHRKPLRIPNSIGAAWELRCGINNRTRVFYDLDVEDRVVVILAVGRKVGNRLVIGTEEFIL